MTAFQKVALTSDIPEGEGISVDVGEARIAIFHLDGDFHAIDGRCAHRGGPLGEGEMEGKLVICPWHSWTYDVTTGQNIDDPQCSVARYEVKVEGESLLVAI